jgi:hypothetical protein
VVCENFYNCSTVRRKKCIYMFFTAKGNVPIVKLVLKMWTEANLVGILCSGDFFDVLRNLGSIIKKLTTNCYKNALCYRFSSIVSLLFTYIRIYIVRVYRCRT